MSKDVSGEYFEKGMGLEIDQNIVDTYLLTSKRVQGGSPANRGLAPLARF